MFRPFKEHWLYLSGKAAKWLYTLRVLKRAGVAGSNFINIYKCSVRSILVEYAVPAWQDITEFLSVMLESIQKRSLKIVFPDCSCDEALTFPCLESLEKTRLAISRWFISAWRLRTCHEEVITIPDMILDLAMKSPSAFIRTKRANGFNIINLLKFLTSFITFCML